MKKRSVAIILLIAVLANAALAQRGEFRLPADYKPLALKNTGSHQKLVENAVAAALETFRDKNLRAEDVAVTLIDLSDGAFLESGSVRGEAKIYPASVSKLFYLVALQRWLEDGRVSLTKELERGQRDMIVDSSNEATQYVLDVLTGTSSGAELPPKEFAKWSFKRNVVNRFYAAQGYININVNQKTFCEDAYGIEQQFRGYKGDNRNMLTTNATARLMAEIVLGRTNTKERTAIMMNLLSRDLTREIKNADDQTFGFTGIALRKINGVRLWSKAGWTSKTRHDVAYFELPDGRKFVTAVYTENFAGEREIIPTIVASIIENSKR